MTVNPNWLTANGRCGSLELGCGFPPTTLQTGSLLAPKLPVFVFRQLTEVRFMLPTRSGTTVAQVLPGVDSTVLWRCSDLLPSRTRDVHNERLSYMNRRRYCEPLALL